MALAGDVDNLKSQNVLTIIPRFGDHLYLIMCAYKVIPSSIVASFLLLGGGGARPPNVPTGKKNHVVRERAKRASASEIYVFSGLKMHSAYIYNLCSGMAL